MGFTLGNLVNTAGDAFGVGLVARGLNHGRGIYESAGDVLKTAAGQSDYHATPGSVPFMSDPNNPAVAEYQRKLATYNALKAKNPGLNFDALGIPPPSPPNEEQLRAGQLMSDRSRILGLASMNQAAAEGTGPSAAQDTLREGAARSIAQNYGMAASGNVMPGQRAALLNAALGQQQAAGQQTARDVGVLKAQEMQQGQTNLAGNLGSLYQGDLNRENANLGSFDNTQGINAGVAANNAAGKAALTKSIISAVGGVAKGAAG